MIISISLPEYIPPGYIIGTRGSTIRAIIDTTRTTIHAPKLQGVTVFTIDGDDEGVRRAADSILVVAEMFAKKENLPPINKEKILAQALAASGSGSLTSHQHLSQSGSLPSHQHLSQSGSLPSQQHFSQSGTLSQQHFSQSGTLSQQHFSQSGSVPHQYFSQSGSLPSQQHFSQSGSLPSQQHFLQSGSMPSQQHFLQSGSMPSQQHFSQSGSLPSQQHFSQSGSMPSQQHFSQSGSMPSQQHFSQSGSLPSQQHFSHSGSLPSQQHFSQSGSSRQEQSQRYNSSAVPSPVQQVSKRPSSTALATATGPTASKGLRMDVSSNEKYANVSVGHGYSSNDAGVCVPNNGFVSHGRDTCGTQLIPHRAEDDYRQSFSHQIQSGSGGASGRGTTVSNNKSELDCHRSPTPAGEFQLEQQVDVPGENGELLKWTVTNVIKKLKASRYISVVLPDGRWFYGFQHSLLNPADTRCRKCNGKGPGFEAVEMTICGKRVWTVQDPAKSHSQCLMKIDSKSVGKVFGSTHCRGRGRRMQYIHNDGPSQAIHISGYGVQQTAPHGSGRHSVVHELNGLLAQQREIEAGGVGVVITYDQKRSMLMRLKALEEKFKCD